MTAVIDVSQKQMKRKTGFGRALGYALPEEDKILVHKDLPDDVRKEVLSHEEEHIEKGEEGPFLGALIGAGGALVGGLLSSRAAGRAADAQVDAANQEIQFARESRDLARADYAPWREAGRTALSALMDMTGLSAMRPAATPVSGSIDYGDFDGAPGTRGVPLPTAPRTMPGRRLRSQYRAYGGAVGEGDYNINELGPEDVYSEGAVTRHSRPMTIRDRRGYVHPHGRAVGGFTYDDPIHYEPGSAVAPVENPGGREGGFSFKADPGYGFRFSEGMRGVERGAAARGGLLSGGFGRRAIRYGQDYASNEYANVYNRIANIAGLGQVGVSGSANAAMYGGAQMGAAVAGAGNARATGYINEGNAWGNAIGQIAQMPWENVRWPWQRNNPSGGSRA